MTGVLGRRAEISMETNMNSYTYLIWYTYICVCPPLVCVYSQQCQRELTDY